MNFRRIKQVCEYGWKDAQTLSQEEEAKKGKIAIFLDILHCFFKYNVWSNQYKKEKLHLLSGGQKKEICSSIITSSLISGAVLSMSRVPTYRQSDEPHTRNNMALERIVLSVMMLNSINIIILLVK